MVLSQNAGLITERPLLEEMLIFSKPGLSTVHRSPLVRSGFCPKKVDHYNRADLTSGL